jgi:hypothetical protein
MSRQWAREAPPKANPQVAQSSSSNILKSSNREIQYILKSLDP